jgi:hypothetical protein
MRYPFFCPFSLFLCSSVVSNEKKRKREKGYQGLGIHSYHKLFSKLEISFLCSSAVLEIKDWIPGQARDDNLKAGGFI